MNNRLLPIKSAFRSAFSRGKLLLILYSAYFLFCIIAGILLSLSLRYSEFFAINNIMSSIYSILSNIDIVGLLLSLLSVAWLFGKYTNYCSNNLIRSLPIKNSHLFFSDFITGLYIFLVPACLSLAVQTIIGKIIESGAQTDAVFSAVGVSFGFILNYVFGFCIAVFCFSLASGMLEGIVLYVVLNFIPSAVYSVIDFSHNCILGTFQIDQYETTLELNTSYDLIYRLIVGDDVQKANYTQMFTVTAVILIVCIAVTVLAYIAFLKLRSAATAASRFKTIISKTAICVLSCYCGFLVLYFKRTGISLFNAFIIIPSMLLVSFIIFDLANTIIYKSLRIPLKKFAPFAAIFVVLCVTGIFYFTGGFGQAVYVPDIRDIASVTLNYGDSDYYRHIDEDRWNRFTYCKFLAQTDVEVTFPITYSDYKSVYSIVKYHESLLEEYQAHDLMETVLQNNENFPQDNPRTTITYTLKDGSVMTRYYNHNGNSKTLGYLSNLRQYENSVEIVESRALSYLKQEPTQATHEIYISPVLAVNSSDVYHVTDSQLQQLVQAVYADENALTDEDILNSEGGDYCVLTVMPDEQYADYFSGVFRQSGEGYQLVVKPLHQNTIAFISELTGEETIKGEDPASIKQILAGTFETSFFQYGSGLNSGEFASSYSYRSEMLFNFYYDACQRFYNTDAVTDSEVSKIDGQTCDTEAIEFLVSKLRLLTSTEDRGMFLFINKAITEPFNKDAIYEEHTAVGERLYYVRAEDWATFLSMCDTSTD